MAIEINKTKTLTGQLGTVDIIEVNGKEIFVSNGKISSYAKAELEPEELKALKWFVNNPLEIKSSIYNIK